MNKLLKVKKSDLDAAEGDWEYLQVILEGYRALWEAEPDKMAENFTDDQLSLLFYGIFDEQIKNGGLLQIVSNGYAPYFFDSPMIEALKKWGAAATADLLEYITEPCLKTADEIDTESLEDLKDFYDNYPEFEDYDQEYYDDDGISEVKAYVEAHLSEFIIVE